MAAIAPSRSTAATIRSAASRFLGIGRPCAKTELSSATTGAPVRSAASTAGRTRIMGMKLSVLPFGKELRVFCSPAPVLCHEFSYLFSVISDKPIAPSDGGQRVGKTHHGERAH